MTSRACPPILLYRHAEISATSPKEQAPRLLLIKALGPDERWITVHPNGAGTTGTPVLIREHADGTATVIGGAAGKLNHLKLRGIKKGENYQSALKDKQQSRQAAKKAQIKADKAAGIHAQKTATRKSIKNEVTKQRAEFVQAVSALAGWDPKDVTFNEKKHAKLSPDALEKARKEHEKTWYKRARETVDINRKRLIEDADARFQADLGEVPITAPDPDTLSVADLMPMPEVSGAKLGFDAKYATRAEQAGLTPEDAKKEAATALATSAPSPDAQANKAARQESKNAISAELESFKQNNPDCDFKPSILEDAKAAAALLKAEKHLKLIERKARDAQRALNGTMRVESKAHVLEISDDEIDQATRKQFEDDLRTAGARSFLETLDQRGGEASVAGHISTGAFNTLNATGLTLGGDALLDRSVVDVLGVSGAAQVLAQRIQSESGPDADKVRQAVEDWHVAHTEQLQTLARSKAQALYDAAASIELPEAEDGFDLYAAQEANRRRRNAIAEAQKILGQAHGEMQAGAALVAALQNKVPGKIEISLGAIAPERAITQLHAIGLQSADYQIAKAGDNLVVTVLSSGMERLTKPYDTEGIKVVRRNLDIMEGKYDEDDWLPLGIAKRPELSMQIEPGIAPSFAEPINFALGHQAALERYIGGRMADGDDIRDIYADIHTTDFYQKSGDPESYQNALNAIAALDKHNSPEVLRESWEKMADDFIAKTGKRRLAQHRQTFPVDSIALDALHRSLCSTPEGVAAWKPVGNLTRQDRKSLNEWWNANLHEEWESYVKKTGSLASALKTAQDLVRSNVIKQFAEHHNRLKPDTPLKLSTTAIDIEPKALPKTAKIRPDQRYSLGHIGDRQVTWMMSIVGKNFKPDQPIKLFNPSMSGGKNYARQRLIKLLEANKRVVAAFGTGSGKSLLQMAGFTHLHAKGKVKKGIILAPSIVQGQFGGEALRFLEPGKYKWHASPGASRDERLAAYRDPDTHFVVATHQSFRDDMIYLGAQRAGIAEDDMAKRLSAMTADERKAWSQEIMKHEGFTIDYMSTDESQYTLNREGKDNSQLANVVDAFADNSEYYMPSSGDPVKNDVSEIYDLLAKMDRKRYADKDAFMRRYGPDVIGSKEALRREMARHVYASKIDPDVKVDRKTITVPLNQHQKTILAQLEKDVSEARISRMEGKTALNAIKRLSPAAFKNVPAEKHEEIAAALQKNIGLLKNAAVRRIINTHPNSANLDAAAKFAAAHKGKPGVIFAHNLETVEHLKARLEKEGHRVVSLTGHDSSVDKDKKRQLFQPEKGDAQADIIVASDAAATGMNLQRGQWLINMDTPDTAMTHAQRNGRIFRTGQKNDVSLIDLVADHPSEQRARERLANKYQLRELMESPMEGMDDTGLAWYLQQRLYQQPGVL